MQAHETALQALVYEEQGNDLSSSFLYEQQVSNVALAIHAAMDNMNIYEPRIPVFSTANGCIYQSAEEIRQATLFFFTAIQPYLLMCIQRD
jgi:hypothetical protein